MNEMEADILQLLSNVLSVVSHKVVLLQALEKLSHEHPQACLRAGGLVAVRFPPQNSSAIYKRAVVGGHKTPLHPGRRLQNYEVISSAYVVLGCIFSRWALSFLLIFTQACTKSQDAADAGVVNSLTSMHACCGAEGHESWQSSPSSTDRPFLPSSCCIKNMLYSHVVGCCRCCHTWTSSRLACSELQWQLQHLCAEAYLVTVLTQ